MAEFFWHMLLGAIGVATFLYLDWKFGPWVPPKERDDG